MKGFIGSFIFAVALLFVVPSATAQNQYTNSQQNFTVNVPGTVDESGSTQGSYALVSFNNNNTLGVMIYSPNIQVDNTRAAIDAIDLSTLGAYNCQGTVYNGDIARLCLVSASNTAGVKIVGKVWLCIHKNYGYAVVVIASYGTPEASQVDPYLNSFSFLK